ncbi:type 1 glutamine amidotransferase domain-containing protein [Microbulbifer sediminum]|uniref:type 1 glutamine amidotransferase domain-containing protein n=1 Tax=Microbulbifer sediminum TaxID=2904250 RepID=UPI001F2CA23F|nr:type 1 glutamine amidotransferase domain-containing protein [Microbulbifer sediminum]
MAERKVLFVLTGHDRLGDTGDKTGFHLSEAAQPWRVLREAGFHVDFATPDGGEAPIDPGSLDLDDPVNREFTGDADVNAKLKRTPALKDLDLTSYEALYFPGGHGTMWDLPDHPDVQAAIRQVYEAGKVVGAVCHGPAALVNVKLDDGSWLVEGKTVSAFTDEEEKAVEKDGIVPFLLASKLKERGATHEKAENFQKSVSVDDRLVTGQNPASARGVGEAIRDRVRELTGD